MRLEQLYYLVEISKTKSISRFAESNCISHQSVSKAIYQLEEEFCVQLLNRSPRGVSLTPNGAAFAKEAAEILSRVDDLAKYKCLDSEREPIGLKGSLSIATSLGGSLRIIQDVADVFCNKNPCVKLKITDHLYEDIIQEVVNGKVDLGLVLRLNNDSRDCKIICVNPSDGKIKPDGGFYLWKNERNGRDAGIGYPRDGSRNLSKPTT